MTIDVEVLSELYTIMKQYVPAKDRQECADNLMSVMVDMLSDIDVKELAGVDNYLKRSYDEYAGGGVDDDDEYGCDDYEE